MADEISEDDVLVVPMGLKESLGGSYQLHLDLYCENGLFVHVMACYCLCREAGKPLPEDLLAVIEDHFTEALSAQSEKAARIALGVGNTKQGGPGQWQTAFNQFERSAKLDLLEQVKAWGGDGTDKDRQAFVAELTGTTRDNLKSLYHQSQRNKKSNKS